MENRLTQNTGLFRGAGQEGFNERLHAFATVDAVANRIHDAGDGRNVEDQTNYVGHWRHNFLLEREDLDSATLAQLLGAGVRDYLQFHYGYDRQREIGTVSDAI